MKRVLFFFLCGLAFAVPTFAAEVREVVSPKGIKAWLVEDKTLPVVSLAFMWRGGVERDGADKQGLSTLATTLLTKGAGEDTADGFEKKLQENAIALDFDARRDFLEGHLRSLKETLPAARTLLKASLMAPRFDEKAVALAKQQLAAQRNMYLAEPDWLLSRLLISTLFDGHPYALRTLGTEKTVAALKQADLKGWLPRLSREGLVVAAAGDMGAEELGVLLDDVFGALPSRVGMAPNAPSPSLKGLGETFVLRHEGPQTALALVWPGLPRHDPQRYVLEVMNYIYGGGSFSSRLMQEVRDKRGLTYGISSGQDSYDNAALYMVQASMKNENAGEVLRLAEQEAEKLCRDPVGAEELQAAKDYLLGAYALARTSTLKVASYYLELQRLQRPMDEENKRAEAIRAVTAADVQAMAQRLFMGSKKAVFAVGMPEGLQPTRTLDKVD